MTYQLVLQFPGDSLADYDVLIALEEQLIVALASSDAEVDGHDCGAGETNLFLRTADARETFGQLFPELERTGRLGTLRAAYRPEAGEEFVVLWPQGFDGRFTVT